MAQKIGKKQAKTGDKRKKEHKPTARDLLIKPAPFQDEIISVTTGKMKICVIGAGAIGGLVAAYLRQKRRNVFLVGRPSYVQAINAQGFRVEGIKGALFLPVPVRSKLEEKVDLVILAVKTQDINDVINANKNFLRDTLILTTQNGVRADKLVAAALGKEQLISSIVMFGATLIQPGRITHNFEGKWILGRPFGPNDEIVKAVAEELAPAFDVVIADDITSMKWTKLFINFNNCIPALLGKSMQETFADLDMAKLGVLFLKEGLAVVDDAGIKPQNLPDFDLNKFRGLTQMPLDEAAKIFSGIMTGLSKEPLYGSILQSIQRGRPSEIEYINGEVVQLCRFGRVGAELNARAVRLVHEVEKTKKFFAPEQIKQFFKLHEVAGV